MRQPKAFTLIELLVVISIIALLIGILLPALGAARRTARQMQSSTQVRGIHNALVTYAQGNKSYFPGILPTGLLDPGNTAPQNHYQQLLERGFFPGEYSLSPADVKETWTDGTVTTSNYSYSMLSIDRDGDVAPEGSEWQDTINTDAIILSDRGIGTNAADATSVWTSDPIEGWRGTVGWNDNHVSFESDNAGLTSSYGDDPVNDADDNLFIDDELSLGDALMTYSGPGPDQTHVISPD